VQRALVAGQIALTLVVALAAVALGRSFFALQNAPLGLDVGPVLTAQLAPPAARFESLFDVSRYFERMIETVRPLPGVTAVSLDASAPLSGISLRYPVWLEGTEREARNAHEAVFHAVGGEYLDTVRLPLVAGRWFDAHDGEHTRSVVVINQALARRLFPDGEALGRRVITLPFIVPAYREIVGIVANAQQDELAGEPPPQIYAPIIQSPWFFGTLLIRLQNPGLGIGPIQAALRAADPTLTMSVQPMAANLARLTLLPRVRVWLFSGFAGVALALSAFGIYASTAFAVKQRTRDLAVRLALGGPPRAVVAWVVTRALRVALLGLLLALPAALASQRLLHGLLVGVPAFEPWAFLLLSALVVLVTISAAAMPASRAARMNPAVVLQAE
jgi:putative ABC transport system permease protein